MFFLSITSLNIDATNQAINKYKRVKQHNNETVEVKETARTHGHGGKNCKFTLLSGNKMHFLAITEVKTHMFAGSGNKDAV